MIPREDGGAFHICNRYSGVYISMKQRVKNNLEAMLSSELSVYLDS